MARGENLTTTLNKNAMNPFVFAVPPFPFTTSFATDKEERLAEIEFFLMHSVVQPNTREPKSHLLACAKWSTPTAIIMESLLKCGATTFMKPSQLTGFFQQLLLMLVLLSALKRFLVNVFVLLYQLSSES